MEPSSGPSLVVKDHAVLCTIEKHNYFTECPSPSASLLSSSSSDSNLHSHTITVTEGPPAAKKKRMFHRVLRFMMHGFGDDPNPYSETVDLVEDLVVEFITEMTLKVTCR